VHGAADFHDDPTQQSIFLANPQLDRTAALLSEDSMYGDAVGRICARPLSGLKIEH
jgi:hypothetical protein